ncbi:hypothetical protein, partial [Nitritalea halalkaliphila]|uniref:hypothetical protein n=1 Tax=Nitritalea halalkaliphila TaxID=590849 RepID=UPI000594E333
MKENPLHFPLINISTKKKTEKKRKLLRWLHGRTVKVFAIKNTIRRADGDFCCKPEGLDLTGRANASLTLLFFLLCFWSVSQGCPFY